MEMGAMGVEMGLVGVAGAAVVVLEILGLDVESVTAVCSSEVCVELSDHERSDHERSHHGRSDHMRRAHGSYHP